MTKRQGRNRDNASGEFVKDDYAAANPDTTTFDTWAELPSVEAVSAAVHEAWMESKRAQGVTSRLSETGEELMVPYDALSDEAKELDRGTVKAVYAAIKGVKGER